ncbi:MAG: phosphate acyltransferase PlsX [Bacillota bacterium]
MRIALDGTGGDHAPAAMVAGALAAAREYGAEVVLVGPEKALAAELKRQGGSLPIHPAEPTDAGDKAEVRPKRGSAIERGLRLVKEGGAEAFVSAGSTAALLTGAIWTLGRIKGIERPALGTALPTASGRGCLLLDMGANTEAKPENLVQFALMGEAYVRLAYGLQRPRIGLLNVGTEPNKGHELAKTAHAMLTASGLEFTGNVEARDLFAGVADVLVCDGFTGNVVLKALEGTVATIFALLRQELTSGPMAKAAALLLKPRLKALKARFDYAEYGGAPFLGVQGLCIKCHGSSDAKAIKNGIRVAARAAGLPGLIAGSLARAMPDGPS